MKPLVRLLALSFLFVSSSGLPGAVRAQVVLQRAFSNLDENSFTQPVLLTAAPDGTGRLFVVEKGGRILLLENTDAATASVFLDLPGGLLGGGERGLLGLAFHPAFATNGRFFVYYSAPLREGAPAGWNHTSHLAEFAVSTDDPDRADPESEQVLLQVDQPFANHNGGHLAFGPDGYLYVGLGDGGSGGDPLDAAEDPTNLLGAILRLDVDGGGRAPDCGLTGNGRYTLPATNPFADPGDDRCGEIYAYGLRNPWRFSFGPDGRLWAGDVGQGAWEEIDWIASGGNYGWDVMEGAHCHEPSFGCDTAGLERPIHEYGRSEGRSITGGYVYEGELCAPFYTGTYIYGDYVSGRIWSLAYDASGATSNTLVLDSDGNISSFGVDAAGELYVVEYDGGDLYTLDCSGLLPVELVVFEAVPDGDALSLTWATASETNNAGFEVEVRQAGTAGWERVGFVAGAGTTLEARRYRFRVEGLTPGHYQARLKQVDFDGAFAYSPTVEVTVEVPGAYHLSAVYPNPFNPQATFTLAVREEQPVQVALFDAVGRAVRTVHDGLLESGTAHRMTLDGAGLPSGVYVLRVTGVTFTAVQTVMLLK